MIWAVLRGVLLLRLLVLLVVPRLLVLLLVVAGLLVLLLVVDRLLVLLIETRVLLHTATGGAHRRNRLLVLLLIVTLVLIHGLLLTRGQASVGNRLSLGRLRVKHAHGHLLLLRLLHHLLLLDNR